MTRCAPGDSALGASYRKEVALVRDMWKDSIIALLCPLISITLTSQRLFPMRWEMPAETPRPGGTMLGGIVIIPDIDLTVSDRQRFSISLGQKFLLVKYLKVVPKGP